VFVVEDHPVIREGLRELINWTPDLVVSGEADDVKCAIAALEDLTPALVVADIRVGRCERFDLIREIKARFPALPVLVISTGDQYEFSQERLALAAGADGYLSEFEQGKRLLQAIRDLIRSGG